MKRLIIVKTFTTRLEAEVAKGVLSANGIPAFFTADDEGGMNPFLRNATGGVKLFVAEKDYKKAFELLKK